MNTRIQTLIDWYEHRNTRERLLALGMSCALLYAIFSLFLFMPIDKEAQQLIDSISTKKNNINNWNTQIDALNKISESPLYKEWQEQHRSFNTLNGQYQFLKNSSSSKEWGDVIRTILKSQPNVTLEEIKNSPETIYNPLNLPNVDMQIYQQELSVVVFSNYFDTINYIKRLEEVLPNIRWNGIKYEVLEYPVAKVEMEFSILYEKDA